MGTIGKLNKNGNSTFVVMGVSGVGKTLVAQCLAGLLGAVYIEADNFHPAENIEAMRLGRPLTDEMRWPWLHGLSEAVMGYCLEDPNKDFIIACSALKRSHRNVIREYLPDAWFIFLTAPPDLIQERISARQNHFMPASLLDSQLSVLEVPDEDERHTVVDVIDAHDVVVEGIVSSLNYGVDS